MNNRLWRELASRALGGTAAVGRLACAAGLSYAGLLTWRADAAAWRVLGFAAAFAAGVAVLIPQDAWQMAAGLGWVRLVVAAVVAVATMVTWLIVDHEMCERSGDPEHRELAQLYNALHSAPGPLDNMCQSLDTAPDIDEHDHAVDLPTDGELVVDSLSFRYPHTDTDVLTDVSRRVAAGERLALVGPTGAGKTTLVNLIMRFYELDGGSILLNGQDTAELTRHDVRARTGMVLQELDRMDRVLVSDAYSRPPR